MSMHLHSEYIIFYFCVINRSMSTISQTTCQQILHMQINVLVDYWETKRYSGVEGMWVYKVVMLLILF